MRTGNLGGLELNIVLKKDFSIAIKRNRHQDNVLQYKKFIVTILA